LRFYLDFGSEPRPPLFNSVLGVTSSSVQAEKVKDDAKATNMM